MDRLKKIAMLNSSEKINCHIKYGFEANQMENAVCFERGQLDSTLRSEVLRRLEEVYSATEGGVDNKKNAAKEMFNKIFQLSSASQVIAVLDYDIPPREVKSANCFRDGFAGKAALEAIKAGRSLEIFNQIKGLSQAADISSVANILIQNSLSKTGFIQDLPEVPSASLGGGSTATATAALHKGDSGFKR